MKAIIKTTGHIPIDTDEPSEIIENYIFRRQKYIPIARLLNRLREMDIPYRFEARNSVYGGWRRWRRTTIFLDTTDAGYVLYKIEGGTFL